MTMKTSRNTKLIGLVVVIAGALLTRQVLSGPAVAQQSPAPAYTLSQLIDGIVYASGPVADRLGHPFAAPVLTPAQTQEQHAIETATLAGLASTPSVATSLQWSLQSGDPYRVKDALVVLGERLGAAASRILGPAEFTRRVNQARAALGLPALKSVAVGTAPVQQRAAIGAASVDGDNDTDQAMDLEQTFPPTPTPGSHDLVLVNSVAGASALAVLLALIAIVPANATATASDDYVALITSRLAV
jgi:hypothetical protein